MSNVSCEKYCTTTTQLPDQSTTLVTVSLSNMDSL